MRELGADVEERNYAKEALTKAEVSRIVAAVGSVEGVMNTRHKTAKENGWKEKAPSKTAFIKAAVLEPNLLRRPITLNGDQAVVGKGQAAIRALFDDNAAEG